MSEPRRFPTRRRRRRAALPVLIGSLLAALALGLMPSGPARAQDAAAAYPARAIHIVVGFPPGGPTDRLAREIAQGLQAAWGQPVLVDNKPGASSRIAFETVAHAEPDGHTLILGSVQTATNMVVHKRPGYDTLRDFAPVTQLTAAVLALTVPPTPGISTLEELLARARARPGELAYASFGVASSAHFAAAMLEQRAGLRLVHVPFSGAAQAQTAVVGGQVQFGFASALSAMPLLQSGRLRALAVTSDKRLPQLPEVPTMAEAGFPGFEVSSWQGLLAPAATPPAIVAKLQREVARLLAQPEVRERLLAAAAEPVGSTPAAFRAYIQAEIAKWGAVARQADLVLD